MINWLGRPAHAGHWGSGVNLVERFGRKCKDDNGMSRRIEFSRGFLGKIRMKLVTEVRIRRG